MSGAPSSMLTNNSVIRPFSSAWPIVSAPEPVKSAYATVLESSTAQEPSPALGETFTWPFNGAEATNLQAAIAACSAPAQVHWIDTTGLLNPALGVDSLGLHPSGPNNLATIAPALASLLRPLVSGTTAVMPPGFRPGFRQSLLA